MNNQYLTESMQIYWMQTLDEYWDKKIHPTQMILIYGLIGCINISIKCHWLKPLKVLISRGNQNNTD